MKIFSWGSGGAVGPLVGQREGPDGGVGGKAPGSSWISAYFGCLEQLSFSTFTNPSFYKIGTKIPLNFTS